jgi:hypothetical protein
MLTQNKFIYRIGAGKAIGLVFGLLGFLFFPYFLSDASLTLRLGILLWYTTLGAIVGVFGVLDKHPILGISLPWWFRGALIGGWMNFVLTLIAYDQICTIIVVIFGEYSRYISPYSMVLEGAIIGLVIDYLLTRWFGEGLLANSVD